MSFDAGLENFADSPAVVNEHGVILTYSMLASKCNQLQEKLGNKKRLILIFCKNNFATLIGYLAALRGNHAAIMVDAFASQEFFEEIIRIYRPDFLWKEHSKNGKYELVFREVFADKSSIHPNLNLLLSTSGSTGSPKLVRLSKKNLYSNAHSIAKYLKLSSTERPITTLPLHYSYGLSIINSHLLVGACILLTQISIVQKEFWNFFLSYSATSLAGVPYTYEMLMRLKFYNMSLPSLRYLTQAGGKLKKSLTEEVARFSENKKINFFVMYGQTEATARISYLPSKKVIEKQDSIGIAIPGGKLWLENSEQKKITKPYCEGEIVYQGKNVMMGYALNRSDLAFPDAMQGILRTGDIGYFDEDNFFYVTGRLKRFLKISGNRISLDQIEIKLREKEYDCVCGGRDDLLLVVTKNPHQVTEILRYIINTFKLHHSLISVKWVESYPLNAIGKIQYQKLFETMIEEKHDS